MQALIKRKKKKKKKIWKREWLREYMRVGEIQFSEYWVWKLMRELSYFVGYVLGEKENLGVFKLAILHI